jgi:hypothetical protein
VADLDDADRDVFLKEQGSSCSGLTPVDFHGDGQPTWALVLIEGKARAPSAKLVVARQKSGQWEATLLETANSSTPVV